MMMAASAGEASAERLRGRRSLAELGEMLRRQERLLAERDIVSRLPDKGKKLRDLAEKLRAAVVAQEEEEEEQRRRKSRSELQRKQEGTTTMSGKSSVLEGACLTATRPPSAGGPHSQVKAAPQDKRKRRRSAGNQTREASHAPQGNLETKPQGPEDPPENAAAQQSASRTSRLLSDAFERLSVAGNEESGQKTEKGQKVESNSNPFQSLPNPPHRRPPHYIEVLEQRAMNPVTRRSQFKTNVLPTESSGSSHGFPDVSSPGDLSSSISAEERRRRDKKHLDDITAARLPPLHHQPSQLISVGESIAIQVQQKEAYEEMQAKLAAQRLAEKLGIKMVHYEPEGEMAASYREVRNEEGYSSAED